MSENIPARLIPLLEFADMLSVIARDSANAPRKADRELPRRSKGGTLRPGPATPLWNELAKLAAAKLERYGDKANLGRILGVPRQRVHEYLVAQTAWPDTERALMLLAWVLQRQSENATPETTELSATPASTLTAVSAASESSADSLPAESTPPPLPSAEKKDVTYYVTLMPPALD